MPMMSDSKYTYYKNRKRRYRAARPDDMRLKKKAKSDMPKPVTLPEVIGDAFDEGAESPYELKDGIVAGLVDKLQAAPSKGSENWTHHRDMIAKYLADSMPGTIRKILRQKTDLWLSGSKILLLLTKGPGGQWAGITDWDIFCSKKGWQELGLSSDTISSSKTEYHEMPGIHSSHHTLWYSNDGRKVYDVNFTVGEYQKPVDFLRQFDFRFLQMAFWFESHSGIFMPQFICLSQPAWVDLANHAIVKSPNSSQGNLQNRINKYVTRGFHDRTGTTNTGLLYSLIR